MEVKTRAWVLKEMGAGVEGKSLDAAILGVKEPRGVEKAEVRLA